MPVDDLWTSPARTAASGHRWMGDLGGGTAAAAWPAVARGPRERPCLRADVARTSGVVPRVRPSGRPAAGVVRRTGGGRCVPASRRQQSVRAADRRGGCRAAGRRRRSPAGRRCAGGAARWFDGRDADGRDAARRVPSATGRRTSARRPALASRRREFVAPEDAQPGATGVRVTTPVWSVSPRDAARPRTSRPRCVVFDMAAYDDLVSHRRARGATSSPSSGPRTGIEPVREALASRRRTAGRPRRPDIRLGCGACARVCRRPLVQRAGLRPQRPPRRHAGPARPRAGVVGEYDGALHLDGRAASARTSTARRRSATWVWRASTMMAGDLGRPDPFVGTPARGLRDGRAGRPARPAALDDRRRRPGGPPRARSPTAARCTPYDRAAVCWNRRRRLTADRRESGAGASRVAGVVRDELGRRHAEICRPEGPELPGRRHPEERAAGQGRKRWATQ